MAAKTQRFTVRVDGCAAPNPGSGGAGVELIDTDDELVLFRAHEYLGEGVTNPEAELRAVALGISATKAIIGDAAADVVTDSQLAEQWLAGKYACRKRHLFGALDEARAAVESGDYHVRWRERGAWNAGVDAEAKHAAQARASTPELAELLRR